MAPFLMVIALYAVCVLLVDPRGEFPLNDDWSYTRSTFRMGTQNQMVVDEFSAPTLVGQALYGALLVRVFGGSFLVLRLSTILLSCGLACLLWYLLRNLGAETGLAWIAILSWIFNPVQFCLSFTFMTEIPFLLLIAAAAAAFLHYLGSHRTFPLLLCGAILGYAYLIRQTSALFMAAIAFCLIMEQEPQSPGRRMLRLLIWASPPVLFVAGYGLWARNHGGATAAARRKFELLRYLSTEQIAGNAWGMLFYLSFFLLPLLAYLLPDLKKRIASMTWKVRLLVLTAWVIAPSAGLWWFHTRFSWGPYLPARAYHGRMPFLLNILYDTGLGPVTLDPTYYGPPAVPTHPGLWLGVTGLVAAGAVALGLLLSFSFMGWRRTGSSPQRRGMLLFAGSSVLIVVLFEVIFSHVQEGGLFDRHILTAALPMMFLAGLPSNQSAPGKREENRPGVHSSAVWAAAARLAPATAAILLLAAFACFDVTATHDYLAWNRLRWELGNELLARKVDPLSISGGFEFNGWNNYDTFRARGHVEKIYYWWYDRPDYLITMAPQENCHILKKLEYFSWLHRRLLPIYLLRRDN
jgi:hypothetical protein